MTMTKTPTAKASASTSRGVSFPYAHLNDWYSKARQLMVSCGCGRLCAMEETDSHRRLIWCGLFLIEVPLKGGDWSLFKKNLDTLDWVPVSELKELPSLQLLPIQVKRKDRKDYGPIGYIQESLTPYFEKIGMPSSGGMALDDFAKEDVETAKSTPEIKERAEKNLIAKTKKNIFRHSLNKSELFSVSDWTAAHAKMKDIFTVKSAGKILKKGDKGLDGVNRAYRSWVKNIWSLIDKDLLSAVATVYWRNPISLSNLMTLATHRSTVLNIATHHRNRLPLLRVLPVETWEALKEESVDPDVFLNRPEFEEISSIHRQAFIGLPVSFKDIFLLSQKKSEVIDWICELRGAGLKDWMVRGFLKKHVIRSGVESWKPQGYLGPISEKTSLWKKEWIESFQVMADFYQDRDGYKILSKSNHAFWGELSGTFSGITMEGWSSISWPDGQGFIDRIPPDHPWSSIVNQHRLEKILTKVEPSLQKSPRIRL